jgi:hypothetical protein
MIPASAVSVSMLLGSTVPSSANERPAGVQPSATDTVSERLAAIREAVSALADHEGRASTLSDANSQLAWGNWWRNWGWRGWGWPNWHNWHNWRNWGNWWHNW